MSKYAPHVYTDPAQIATLETWVTQLPGQAQVQVTLDDGSRVVGTVAVRPTLQTFRDEHQQEGVNGQLRLDQLDASQQPHWLWLDRIAAVEPLPTVE
ncbi:DUF3247 family protein [Xanthomonas sp. Kuri4-1]